MQEKFIPMLPMRQPTPPELLVGLQDWMSRAVSTQSIGSDKELGAYITPSSTLTPAQRLDIYVQDYWGRAKESLEEDFPCVKRWLGADSFSEWITRYMERYPSKNFSLYPLGRQLTDFFIEEYAGLEKLLLLDLVRYDWAKAHAYFAGSEPRFNPVALSEDQQSEMDQLILPLQPHLHLLKMDYDILAWESDDLMPTPSKKLSYVAVYRYLDDIESEEINPCFYEILTQLGGRKTLFEAIDHISNQINAQDNAYFEGYLEEWFAYCVSKGWFCHPLPNPNI